MQTGGVVLRACTALFFAITSTLALGDPSSDRVDLDAAMRAWESALIARDADAMAALTTDDFAVLPPNAAAVRGREAASAVWARMKPSDVVRISISAEETAVDGDLAYQMGSFAHTLSNGRDLMHGMYINIWKRIDGEWRIHRHMFSGIGEPNGRGLVPVPVKNEPRLDSPPPR